MTKIKKSVTLDQNLVYALEDFSNKHNLKFSQSLNIALSSFVTKYGVCDDSLKIILKKMIDKL